MTDLLAGVRVLDLTNVLAGPFCGYQLALLQAEVIKIESPDGGDLARQLGADATLNQARMGASFLAQNAGKKSVVLDLKDPDDKGIFLELVKTADVVLENFRPGVMDRLGLGYEHLKTVNPMLVYCGISGFGQDGPLAKAPAYDQIIQGLSGLMSITGDETSAPLRVGYPVCDTIGGLTAAFAISAALLRRHTRSVGAFIDVSMLDSTLVSMGWIVSNYLIAGQAPLVMGNDNFTASPSGAFATADGLINIAANKQQQFEILCDVIDSPDLKTDARFAEREARKVNRIALKSAIESKLCEQGAAHWEDRLNRHGVPAGRVLDVTEALAQDQIVHRDLLVSVPVDAPGRDTIVVTRSGFRVDGQGTDPITGPPTLGAQTTSVLADVRREISA